MQLFRRLGLFIENRLLWIIIASAVLAVASIFAATQVTMVSGIKTFISPSSQTYRDYTRFNQHFSGDAIMVIVTGDNMILL